MQLSPDGVRIVLPREGPAAKPEPVRTGVRACGRLPRLGSMRVEPRRGDRILLKCGTSAGVTRSPSQGSQEDEVGLHAALDRLDHMGSARCASSRTRRQITCCQAGATLPGDQVLRARRGVKRCARRRSWASGPSPPPTRAGRCRSAGGPASPPSSRSWRGGSGSSPIVSSWSDGTRRPVGASDWRSTHSSCGSLPGGPGAGSWGSWLAPSGEGWIAGHRARRTSGPSVTHRAPTREASEPP
jgi:hypothetical protein